MSKWTMAFFMLLITLEMHFFLIVLPREVNTPAFTSVFPVSYGHLDHLPHYNTGGNRYSWGNYSSFIALEPEYGVAKQQPTAIEFSIQDRNNNDVYNVTTMVEVYETISGDRVHVFPWTFRDIGDFILFYTFPQIGNYQIVLSILDNNKDDTDHSSSLSELIGIADPPRTLLSNTRSCDCERTVYNISISPAYGIVQNIMYAVVIILPVTVLGYVLLRKYRSHRNWLSNRNNLRTVSMRKEIIRYLVMLLAIGGGILHLAVFQDHATLHIYYSLFLLAAAASQVAYGIVFVLITLSGDGVVQLGEKKSYGQMDETEYKKQRTMHIYRRNMVVNLFGLFGTSVLIGLYIYSVIFPPPLSPTDTAEEVDIEGVSAKLLELFLVIGIAAIIKWDRQEMKYNIVHLSNI